MFPELFSLGPVTVYTYGVVLAAAYLLGLQLAMRRAKARGMDPNRALDLGIAIIVSALIGAKLLLVLVDFDHFRRNPGELFSIVRAGGVFYGGLIAAILVAFWYMRRHKMPLWLTTDIFAPGISLGHAVGRLGCLAAGCCYGHPTDVAWAITFTNPAAAANVGTPLGVPLHPTQLYESGTELVILAFLLLTEKKGRPFPGTHLLGVPAAVRLVAFRDRVLPRRSARDGVWQHLDVAVHLADPGPAQPRHAGVPVAGKRRARHVGGTLVARPQNSSNASSRLSSVEPGARRRAAGSLPGR